MIGLNDDKPPPCVCDTLTNRILPISNDGRIARRRKMDFVYYLSNPKLSSRFRNDLFILDSF
jgi:hypothetical protein